MNNFRWANDGTTPSLKAKFILSDEQKPRLSEVLSSDSAPFPIVDMDRADADEEALVKEIARASEEYGFFRIVNHGVQEEVWRRAAEAVRDFFQLPTQEKAHFAGGGFEDVKVFSYFLYDWDDEREISMWSEVVNHRCHPTEDFAGALPENPAQYRENMVTYAKEMGRLMTRLLSLLSKALGLEDGYLKRRLGQEPFFKFHGNYFPPCPEPELTIGLPVHTDSLALGVVRTLDDVEGLQVIKDGQWIALDRIPDSFTVNIGDQLEVLSNGRYKSVHHRVVTNESRARVSLAFFLGPGLNERVGPIEDLIDERHPRLYRSFVYKEYIDEHDKQKGKRRRVKQLFQLQPSAN